MADNKWIHIDNWMGKILGLKANELLCFAVIYGFTRDGMTEYKCNLSYLASTIFATKQTTFTVLKKLVEHNLILKREEMISGIKYCFYQTNIIYNEGKIYKVDPIKEPLIAIKESLTATIKESLTQYTNNKNKEKDKTSTTSSPMRENDYLSNEEKELMNDESYQELIAMRYHLTTEGVKDKITDFIIECRCNGIEMHQNSTDLRSHFNNWLRIQQNGNDRKSNKQRNDGESATERFIRVFGGNTPEHAGDTQGEHIKGSPFVD